VWQGDLLEQETTRMQTVRKFWWISLGVLLAPALYFGYWVRGMAQDQAGRMDTIALSIAENGAAWEGITLGGEHPLQVYQDLRQTNEYMMVAGTLSAVLLAVVAVLLAAGWLTSRRRQEVPGGSNQP